MGIPIGLLVRAIREEAGLSLRAAAPQIGVSPSFLYKFEEFELCMDPFSAVSKNANFAMGIEKFFSQNIEKITNEPLKKFTRSMLDSDSIITNLFQDCFYLSLLNFLSYSFVQVIDEYEVIFGGLYYILKQFLFDYEYNLLPSTNAIAIGRLHDQIRSFFLIKILNEQWGEKRTKRRKLAKTFDDIVFYPCKSKKIIGYISGNENFLERMFYNETFANLILYLLLDKFSCSFFVKNKNEQEQKKWDDFQRLHNQDPAKSNEPIIFPSNQIAKPPFRDVLVLSTHKGTISICCRSLIAGYHYDMFVLKGDILSTTISNLKV